LSSPLLGRDFPGVREVVSALPAEVAVALPADGGLTRSAAGAAAANLLLKGTVQPGSYLSDAVDYQIRTDCRGVILRVVAPAGLTLRAARS
jgi:hypothetical protein